MTVTTLIAPAAFGGGSGFNTIVVLNQASTNSVEAGNYYCERRHVPPENVLRIFWEGSNISWSSSDFEDNLAQPLMELLAERQLTNQLDYVVLSMDIPFQTVNDSVVNSTTSALFYGLKPDTNVAGGYLNSYAGSEAAFRFSKPGNSPGYSFLTTMITADSLAQARQLIDQGATSDGAAPRQPVVLEKTSDPARNVRYLEFDNAIFNVQVLGKSSMFRTNSDLPPGPLPVLGYQTGLANLTLRSNSFVSGAMADSLSSFGGDLFEATGQTSLLAFTEAGAAGSYGTVAEPLSDPQKFPNPQNYFYQARGFSLAESYYQSLYDPYLGLIVGEPLAAPFAVTGAGYWSGVTSNAVLTGVSQLSVNFSAYDQLHPLSQIDLFVDGRFFQTLTNLAPAPGNQVTVALDGYPITYTVPTNATPGTVAAGLAALLNVPAITNITKVKAVVFGDRIELRSMSTNYLAEPFYFLDSATTNGTADFYRINYLPFPTTPQLGPISLNAAGAPSMHLETTPGVPYTILASTNLVDWAPISTNLLGGEQDFADPEGSAFPQRFFRLASPPEQPDLSLSDGPNGSVLVHVRSQTSLGYVVQVSTDLASWTPILTNAAGGSLDFEDDQAVEHSVLFYRAMVLLPVLPSPAVSISAAPMGGGALVAISSAQRRYTVSASSDLLHWTPVLTNFDLAGGQVAAGSSAGAAGAVATFLNASGASLQDSPGFGLRAFYFAGAAQPGAWLQLAITKTNGTLISLAVTNQSGGASLATLAQQLCAAVNTAPLLQTSDGVAAEDFATDAFGDPSFHLRARSPGYNSATLRAQIAASSGLSISPGGNVSLMQNLSDLQPRAHLYVKAGLASLGVAWMFDTTALADGYHELTAIAYQGDNVRTQTRITIPIQIQNSALSASLALFNLTNGAPAAGLYQVQVEANAQNVEGISLYSTGGLLASAADQNSATFTVDAGFLGAGLHPFYACVQTQDGLRYRTAIQWVRLSEPP